LERTSDQVDLGHGFHEHLHHIESIRDPRIVEESEPFFCASDDPLPLRLSHSEMRGAERVSGTRFDFNEHQGCFPAITANQIDFAPASCFEVLVKNAESAPAKVSGRQYFAGATELEPCGRRFAPCRPESNRIEKRSE
jgi:hypothetical protein